MPAFLTSRAEKRKSQDDVAKDSENIDENKNISDLQSPFNPSESLSVEIPAKKGKTATITLAAVSPVLLECPEQDCGKKYKHVNGLKYHQSHAHGAGSVDEDSEPTPESPLIPPTSPTPAFLNLPQKETSGMLTRQESQTDTANHSRSPTPTSTSTSTSTSTVTPTVTPTRTPSPTNSPTQTPPPETGGFQARNLLDGSETDASQTKTDLPNQEKPAKVSTDTVMPKQSTSANDSNSETQGNNILLHTCIYITYFFCVLFLHLKTKYIFILTCIYF